VIGLLELFGNFAFGGVQGEPPGYAVRAGTGRRKWPAMSISRPTNRPRADDLFREDRQELYPLHKYTLGSELREKSREIVGLIIKANSTVEKLPGGGKRGQATFPKAGK
jgi:hypothetical protein